MCFIIPAKSKEDGTDPKKNLADAKRHLMKSIKLLQSYCKKIKQTKTSKQFQEFIKTLSNYALEEQEEDFNVLYHKLIQTSNLMTKNNKELIDN